MLLRADVCEQMLWDCLVTTEFCPQEPPHFVNDLVAVTLTAAAANAAALAAAPAAGYAATAAAATAGAASTAAAVKAAADASCISAFPVRAHFSR